MSNILARELLADEVLQWWTRPRRGLRVVLSDLPYLLAGLLMTSFAVFWEIAASDGTLPLQLMGVVMMFAGLQMSIGRLFLAMRRRATTVYAITNRRVLIVDYMFGRAVTSLPRARVTELHVKAHGDGSSTVTFGPRLVGKHAPESPKFEHIDDAQTPMALLSSIPAATYR